MPSSHRSTAGQTPLLHAFCHRCERWRVVDADVFDTDAFTVHFSLDGKVAGEALCPNCGEQGLVMARLPEPRATQPTLLALEELPDERWRAYF